MHTLENPLRFSHLKTLGSLSPAHLAAKIEHEDTASTERGTAFHALLLGTRDVVGYEGRRDPRSKDWIAFQAEHPDAEILPAKELAKVKGMVDALMAYRGGMFARALADARARGGVEKTIPWTHCKVPCRATPDLWVPEWVAEVKSCRSSSPDEWEFPKAALRLGYHAQLSWYGAALRAAKLGDPKDFLIFAVESEPPHVVTLFRLTSALGDGRNGREGSLEAGTKLWRRWFEEYKVCRDSKMWPPYSTETCDLDVLEEAAALTFGDDEDAAVEAAPAEASS